MKADITAKHPNRFVQMILAVMPSKSLVAACFLGLMWGPILVSVLDAMNLVSRSDAARIEAGTDDPALSRTVQPETDVPAAQPFEATHLVPASLGPSVEIAGGRSLTQPRELLDPLMTGDPQG